MTEILYLTLDESKHKRPSIVHIKGNLQTILKDHLKTHKPLKKDPENI